MREMKGTYRFYQDGQLVGKSENIVTDLGKRQIMRFLANETGAIGTSLAVGVGSSRPLASDTRLTYEFDRSTIYLISPNYIDNKIIFKTTLEQVLVGNIHEVGLYSSDYSSSSTLASFERDIEAWSSDSFASGNQRLGYEALRLAPAVGGTLTSNLPSIALDLSTYRNTDEFSLAFHSGNADASTVRVRFRAPDPTNYYEYAVVSPRAGYNVVSFAKSMMTKIGAPTFSNIDSIEVSVSSTATGGAIVDFDGIRVDTKSTNIDNVLVSRSVLSTPIKKTDVSPLDIEYALEVLL